MTRSRLDAARRHLQVFADSWKTDHRAAMQCRDFEDMLAEGVIVFQFFDELVQRRRQSVFHDLMEPMPEVDQEEKEIYTEWLQLVEQDIPQLESLEKTFGSVEGAERFRACMQIARRFLANWAPAVASTAVAHRAIDLTAEEADELRTILNNPAQGGRLKWEPRAVPKGDPAKLR